MPRACARRRDIDHLREKHPMSKHVVAAKIKHETNGFNRALTTLEHFRSQELHAGDAVFPYYRGTRLEMGAFIDSAAQFGWSLDVPISTFANPSGVVADEAFEHLCGLLLAGLQRCDRIDGVLLALHGAMFTESHGDAEGELLARVRQVVGPRVPVAVTLDPHANVTRRMVAHADIITAFRTSPHTDHYETGKRAAQLLNETMLGRLHPVLALARRPQLQGFDGARTYVPGGPMLTALAQAEALQAAHPEVACVSIQAGFSRCDIAELGPTVVVVTNGAHPCGQAIAESLMDYCWQTRAVWSDPLVDIGHAVAAAVAHPAGLAPLVLGDYGDAPGGGSYGDSTRLLQALLDAGVRNGACAAIYDPITARQALDAGVGASIDIVLGARSDPHTMGEPIRAQARVRSVSPLGDMVFKGPYGTGSRRSFGPSVCLEIGGFSVIVSSRNLGLYDLEQFRIFGVEPSTCSVVVVKCMQGHHAAFDPIGSKTLDVDTGGLTSADLSRFSFTHVPRPVWPLDAMSDTA